MKRIWDGTGEVAEGEAYFTTAEGIIRGRPYVRERVRRHLSHRAWLWGWSIEERRAALVATVDNDAWLSARNGYLVSALCREVEAYLKGF